MKKSFLLVLAGGLVGLGAFQLSLGAKDDKPSAEDLLKQIPLQDQPLAREGSANVVSYAATLKKATPAVVSVYTARTVQVVRGGRDPREEFFRRFFGMPFGPGMPGEEGEGQNPGPRGRQGPVVEERKMPSGMGSGVIVSADGYILTNNHVITGESETVADEILVRLNDERELKATVVGRDPKTDVAVLKVEANDLPFLPVADSNGLEVGDVVFAIGNPMGVGITVTQGIVSATGRSGLNILGRDGFENFIQTDASINPGNSGGALIDAQGRLVGINTAILSRSGGNIGIGFAIPSTMAHGVLVSLVTTGEVKRGFLGVTISDLTEEMAEASGAKEARGALVNEVTADMPAAKAGIKRGDIITEVNGRRIQGSSDLRLAVAAITPGTKVPVKILRDGKEQSLTVQLGDRDGESVALGGANLVEGVAVAPLDPARRQRYSIDESIKGLVVTEVKPNSPYARYLREGMVILEVNGREVASAEEARQALRPSGANRLYVHIDGNFGYLAFRMNP